LPRNVSSVPLLQRLARDIERLVLRSRGTLIEGINPAPESHLIDIPLEFDDFNDSWSSLPPENLQTLAALRCGSIISRSEGKSFGRYERTNFIRGVQLPFADVYLGSNAVLADQMLLLAQAAPIDVRFHVGN